jgi:hypothetical protein
MSFSRPSYRPTEILSSFATGDIWGTSTSGSRQSELVVLDRDALATFVSPCLDNQPTASGFHPLAKSMGFGPVPVIGLVCSLWHSLVSLKT